MFPFSLLSCSPSATSCEARPPPPPALALLPFAAVFLLVSALAHTRLLPLLSALVPPSSHESADDYVLPTHAPAVLRAAHAEHARKAPRRRAAALAFSVTVGLTAVLGVLIVGEVAQVFDARARGFALGLVVPGLAACLVLVIPWLETMSIVVGAGRSFSRSAKGRLPKITWAMQLVLFGAWLFVFWSMGGAIRSRRPDGESDRPGAMRASLDRIGIAGISVMATLSGFAAVSTPWHTFLSPASRRPVSEAEIARKQAGLDAANEMLLTKRHRVQALEHKAAESSAHSGAAGTSLVGKVLSSIRGPSADETEIRALKMEISGLITMRDALASGLTALERRRAEKVRSESLLGKVLAVPNYAFCVYCVYRVAATLMTALSRVLSGWSAGANAGAVSEPPPDPITRVLSLLTTHYDPTLDQAALSRQISFLLSGVILLLSLSSVLQTLTLLARFAPRLLRLAQANLPLLLAQTLATYVFSSALLLRCNLPREASGVVGDALRTSLEPVFVEGWFQGWFLVGCAVTAAAIWIGRKVAWEDGWDDLGMEEMGQKRS